MTFRKIPALTALAALAVGFTAAVPSAADAQTRKRQVYPPKYINYGPQDRVIRTRSGRIIVQHRSFLSGGTESLQRDQHYSDYSHPPNYRPFIDHTDPKVSFTRMPLPDAWDIPGWPKF